MILSDCSRDFAVSSQRVCPGRWKSKLTALAEILIVTVVLCAGTQHTQGATQVEGAATQAPSQEPGAKVLKGLSQGGSLSSLQAQAAHC